MSRKRSTTIQFDEEAKVADGPRFSLSSADIIDNFATTPSKGVSQSLSIGEDMFRMIEDDEEDWFGENSTKDSDDKENEQDVDEEATAEPSAGMIKRQNSGMLMRRTSSLGNLSQIGDNDIDAFEGESQSGTSHASSTRWTRKPKYVKQRAPDDVLKQRTALINHFHKLTRLHLRDDIYNTSAVEHNEHLHELKVDAPSDSEEELQVQEVDSDDDLGLGPDAQVVPDTDRESEHKLAAIHVDVYDGTSKLCGRIRASPQHNMPEAIALYGSIEHQDAWAKYMRCRKFGLFDMSVIDDKGRLYTFEYNQALLEHHISEATRKEATDEDRAVLQEFNLKTFDTHSEHLHKTNAAFASMVGSNPTKRSGERMHDNGQSKTFGMTRSRSVGAGLYKLGAC